MSAFTNLWRQLVQRRLWPVAILLVAALAAVPLALAKEPDPAAPAPALAGKDSGDSALAVQPIVAQASVADQTKRRSVLGTRKNPFGLPPDESAGSGPAPDSNGSTMAQEPTTSPAKHRQRRRRCPPPVAARPRAARRPRRTRRPRPRPRRTRCTS